MLLPNEIGMRTSRLFLCYGFQVNKHTQIEKIAQKSKSSDEHIKAV